MEVARTCMYVQLAPLCETDVRPGLRRILAVLVQ
jgi:hypothetical protein